MLLVALANDVGVGEIGVEFAHITEVEVNQQSDSEIRPILVLIIWKEPAAVGVIVWITAKV